MFSHRVPPVLKVVCHFFSVYLFITGQCYNYSAVCKTVSAFCVGAVDEGILTTREITCTDTQILHSCKEKEEEDQPREKERGGSVSGVSSSQAMFKDGDHRHAERQVLPTAAQCVLDSGQAEELVDDEALDPTSVEDMDQQSEGGGKMKEKVTQQQHFG